MQEAALCESDHVAPNESISHMNGFALNLGPSIPLEVLVVAATPTGMDLADEDAPGNPGRSAKIEYMPCRHWRCKLKYVDVFPHLTI